MTGAPPYVPSVRSATVALSILSVPSVTVVAAVRFSASVSVPAPVFSSALAVGAEMVAETPESTETDLTERSLVPAMVASALNAIEFALTSSASVAVALAVAKIALLPSLHVAFAPSFSQASVSPQFALVPRQV